MSSSVTEQTAAEEREGKKMDDDSRGSNKRKVKKINNKNKDNKSKNNKRRNIRKVLTDTSDFSDSDGEYYNNKNDKKKSKITKKSSNIKSEKNITITISSGDESSSDTTQKEQKKKLNTKTSATSDNNKPVRNDVVTSGKSVTTRSRSVSRTQNNKNDLRSKNNNILMRSDSASSVNSEKVFTKHKIIRESFVSLQRISEFKKYEHPAINCSKVEIDNFDSDKCLSKNEAFLLKNSLHKYFEDLKNLSSKLENEIENTRKNYYYRENLRFSDATRVMIECKNILRNLRDKTNDCDKRMINRYARWCKKTNKQNIFLNGDNDNNDTNDTPKRWNIVTNNNKAIINESHNNSNDNMSTDNNSDSKSTNKCFDDNNHVLLDRVEECVKSLLPVALSETQAPTEVEPNRSEVNHNQLNLSGDLFSDTDDTDNNGELNVDHCQTNTIDKNYVSKNMHKPNEVNKLTLETDKSNIDNKMCSVDVFSNNEELTNSVHCRERISDLSDDKDNDGNTLMAVEKKSQRTILNVNALNSDIDGNLSENKIDKVVEKYTLDASQDSDENVNVIKTKKIDASSTPRKRTSIEKNKGKENQLRKKRSSLLSSSSIKDVHKKKSADSSSECDSDNHNLSKEKVPNINSSSDISKLKYVKNSAKIDLCSSSGSEDNNISEKNTKEKSLKSMEDSDYDNKRVKDRNKKLLNKLSVSDHDNKSNENNSLNLILDLNDNNAIVATSRKNRNSSSDIDHDDILETNAAENLLKSSSDSDDNQPAKKTTPKISVHSSFDLDPNKSEKRAKDNLLNSSSDSDDNKSEKKISQKTLSNSSLDSDSNKQTLENLSSDNNESEKKSTEKPFENLSSDPALHQNSSGQKDSEPFDLLSDSEHDKLDEHTAKENLLKSSSDSDRDDLNQAERRSSAEFVDKSNQADTTVLEDESVPTKLNISIDKSDEKQIEAETTQRNIENHESDESTEQVNTKKKTILDNNGTNDKDDQENVAKKRLLSNSSESDRDLMSDNDIDTIRHKNNKNEKVENVDSDTNREKIQSDVCSSYSSTKIEAEKKNVLKKNKYYKNDKKLRMKCTVRVEQLNKVVLAQHSHALQLSKEYLENKQIHSLLSLDCLERKKPRRHNNSSSGISDDDDELRQLKLKKKQKNSADDETLLDHLKKIASGDNEQPSDLETSDTDLPSTKTIDSSNLARSFAEGQEKLAKATLLDSSGSEVDMAPNDNQLDSSDEENKKKENKGVKKETNDDEDDDKGDENLSDKDDDNGDKSESSTKKDLKKSSWKNSKILTAKFSDTDSEEENKKTQKKLAKRKNDNKTDSDNDKDAEESCNTSPIKKKKVRTRRRILGSDESDVRISDSSSDDNDKIEDKDGDDKNKKDENEKDRKKMKKRRQRSDTDDSDTVKESRPKKRKRIRAVADSDSSDSGGEQHSSQASGKGSGRKNIRKVIKDKQVASDTLQAAKQEEERLRRMADRQKLFNQMYETRLANEEKVDKLILDFDEETKEILLSVDENLVKRLKPHQAKGIKFMWDACFESLERIKTSKGSGCIIAHCMGLGKSFQVVTLTHTVLTYSEKTGVNTVLIVAPLSTVLNWLNEFKTWLSAVSNCDDIELYEMTKAKTTIERRCQLENWQRTGGVMIMGYEMFRNLCAMKGKVRKTVQEAILKCVLDPGPDLIICDEGHLLKNEDSAISKAIRRVSTLRRIVLTGTPLQNNLIEYHCMVQFVKPNLLGTKKEFSNRFANPIQNGQFDDSTEYDVKLMKRRAHVLHKMLEGSVQRFDYSVLTPFLPPKQEYVILVKLTEVQCQKYQYYLDNLSWRQSRVGGSLFADFQGLHRIWTHPYVMKLHAENSERIRIKKLEAESDSEGSLKDFIDDDSDSNSSSSSSNSSRSSDSDVVALDNKEKHKFKRSTRNNPVEEEPAPPEEEAEPHKEWWTEYVKDEHYDDMRQSAKLLILFDILKEAEQIGDKVLVFSQSLYSLSLIEKFLNLIDDETQNGNELETLDKHSGSWSLGLDYFRFDGQTSAENRTIWVKSFNKPSNTRARLFLISTRAGGLGINLTAANRVVIFDASWNPSHDVQSIFRIYRFGQKKPCYVYRLLAAGTMEEKIYNRQVTKLSLSCRVVDEQQIERHYGSHDLAELYQLELPKSEPTVLALPKDRLLAEIFLRHKDKVENYHEHDSLLENIAEEELDEEERKQAWQEYEDEKAGKRQYTSSALITNFNAQMMIQQQMMNTVNLSNPVQQLELGQLVEMIKKDYPHLTESAQREMAFRALNNMYSYVENQFTGHHGPVPLAPANVQNINPILPNVASNNPSATLANLLAQQEYTRAAQQHRQIQYAQRFGNVNTIGTANQPKPKQPTTLPGQYTSTEDEIIEIPSSSKGNSTTTQGGNKTKRQEE